MSLILILNEANSKYYLFIQFAPCKRSNADIDDWFDMGLRSPGSVLDYVMSHKIQDVKDVK